MLAREGGWRKGCPTLEGPDLTQEPDSLGKLKELRMVERSGAGSMDGQEGWKGSWGQAQNGLLLRIEDAVLETMGSDGGGLAGEADGWHKQAILATLRVVGLGDPPLLDRHFKCIMRQ